MRKMQNWQINGHKNIKLIENVLSEIKNNHIRISKYHKVNLCVY